MPIPNQTKLATILLLILLISIACRQRDAPTPTVEPLPTAEPATATAEPAPTTAAEPTATSEPDPTATPEPVEPTPEPTVAPLLEADWEPQLIYSSPSAGQATPLDGAITVRFDQPMDQASVEAAFSVDGDVDGAFQWTRPDTLVFTPEMQLTRAQTYTVRISEDARGVNGKTLREPLSLDFQTVGFLEVSQIIPDDATDEVAVDSSITVMFNRPVVPLVSTGQQGDLPSPITIEPAVEGEGMWVGTSIYRFQPNALAGATNYRVTVNEGLQDVTGGVLSTALTTDFTTVSPKVIDYELPRSFGPQQKFGEGFLRPTDSITITFNMPMDTASTQAAIALEPSAELAFNWNDDQTRVGVSSAELPLNTDYTLSVSQSAQSPSGAGLEEASSKRFATFPFPAVDFQSSYPRRNTRLEQFEVGYFNSANISFVSPMNWETVEDRITIEPQPERIGYRFHSPQSFNLEFDIDYNSAYTITIPGTVEDVFGNQMGEPAVLSFSTSDFPPLAAFNLPFGIAQFSSNFPTDVAVAQRNINETFVYLERFADGVPILTLLNASNGGFFGQSVTRFDESQVLREIRLDPVDGAQSTTLSLNDGAALANGVYLLRAEVTGESEQERQQAGWQNRATFLVVADTNLVIKETPDRVYVWATDLATGQPATGRDVFFYANYGGPEDAEAFAVVTTNEFGLGKVQKENLPTEWRSWDGNVMAVTGQPGSAEFGLATIAQSTSINPYQLGVSTDLSSETPETAYIHTERPLYRAGDTVYIRGWLRDSNYARYGLPARDAISVFLQSADYRIEQVELADVPIDANGNFATEFVIPEDAALGAWSLSIANNGPIAGRPFANFTVAEFRKPEFAVGVTATRAEALRDETVSFTISAEYFFGGNAAGLPVDWSLFATPYTPDLNSSGPYFSYGINDFSYFFNPFGGFFGNYVTGSSDQLDENGELVVNVTPELLSAVEDGSITLTLDATVRDLSENFIAADAEMILHSAETYVGIRAQEYVSAPDSEVAVELTTIDWNGNIVPSAAIDVVFAERTWESRQGDDGFGFGTIWEPVDTEVARVSVTSDASGEATASFVPERSGSYVATATVLDSAGRENSSNTILYVFGNSVNWRFDAADRKMVLTADTNEYRVGDTAQILVQSPFDTATQAWLTIERGEIIEERVVTLDPGGGVLDIPIAAGYAPNVFVGVTTIKPTDSGERPWADIRFGLTELTVNPEQLALNIDISTGNTQYAPRNTVTYEITATDFNGEGVSAEISLALVDLAILTLKEDDAPTLLETFYAPVPLRSRVGSGLFNSAEGLADLIPDAPLGGRGGGGGGGGIAETAAFDLEREGDSGDGDVRSDFRDTAFWQATVRTDANGKATVEVTLPDNLTTWRMTARGVSPDDTLVGEATQDIIATKPLLIRPVTPRFFTYGDRVQIGAVVNNNTDSDIEGSALLEAMGVAFEDAAEQGVTVPANGSVVVRWPVFIEDVDEVDLTFRVESADYNDASKPTVSQGQPIPVYRYDAEDIVATAGVLDEENRQVEAVILPPLLDEKRGDLSVNLSPSLAAAIFDSLEAYGEEDDEIYLCPYGLALRILPNVATANAIRSLALDESALLTQLDVLTERHIERLVGLRINNGWGWCYGSRQDPYVTAMVIHALVEASKAGFAVDSSVIGEGLDYLRSSAEPIDAASFPYSANRKAYFLYVISLAKENDVSAELNALLDEARDFLTPNGLALVQMAYDNSGAEPPTNLLSDLANAVVLSATGAHWEGGYSFNFGSDIRTTATVIQALAQTDAENPLLPNALRWLMAAREGRYWRSATENAWSIAAVNQYMLATGEIDGDYDYTLTVNGGIEADGSFSRENITTSELVALPIADLNATDINFLDFQKDGAGSLYYAAYLDAFVSADSVDAVDRGFSVSRAYYDADCDASVETCEPIDSIEAGAEVRVELTIIVPNNRRFVQIEDPLPAGADAINPDLDTASIDATAGQIPSDGYRFGYWGWWYFERIEFRDQKVVFLADYLPAGTYQYSYNLNAIVPGEYQVMPTLAKETATPEVFGRANGHLFIITP